MFVVDLFAGCGGLSLGFEKAGCQVLGYEKNRNACAVYERNLSGECKCVQLSTETQFELGRPVDIVVAGPPCQPFRMRGIRQGQSYSRDKMPIVLHAVQTLRPKFVLVENAANLASKKRLIYLDCFVAQLRQLGYHACWKVLNAADYGVPQTRKRLFVAAHLGGFSFELLKATKDHVTVGDVLLESSFSSTSIAANPELTLPQSMKDNIDRYERDNLCDHPGNLNPNKPSRFLTRSNLCGKANDTLHLKTNDGQRRRLLVEEAALLHTFSENFFAHENRSTVMNCIGNATPPLLAFELAKVIVQHLSDTIHKTPMIPSSI